MTQSPPETLIQYKTAQDSRKFGNAKDELREVDVQAEAADVQAQAVVQQAGGEPAGRGDVRPTVRSGEGEKQRTEQTNREQIVPDRSQDEGALSQVRDPEDVQRVFFLGSETCLHLRRKGEKNA